MRSEASAFLGVDIGGTKVAAGLVDWNGRILREARTPMIARRGEKQGLHSVFQAIDAVLQNNFAEKIGPIGISVPGWVDAKRGIVRGATNIPCWRDFPLGREISKQYRTQARVANDANLAALAELHWGVGAGSRNLFYASFGTGVGTGFIVDGRIYDGRTGAATEGGHVSINFEGPRCGCGKLGCIEAYASGPSIARRARELLKTKAKKSALLRLANGRPEAITTETIAHVAEDGDKFANSVLEETARYVAIWLGSMFDLLEPDVIVIGGGIGHLLMTSLPQIRRELKKWAINPGWKEVPIREAKFGAESSLIGAAALAMTAGK